jgi:hypothetical protein
MAQKKSGALAPIQATLPANAPEIVRGASLWDESDPDSLINKATGALRSALIEKGKTPEARKILRQGEQWIREHIKPTPQMARIRIAFWDEYARSVDTGNKMISDRIYGGIMARESFEEDYFTDATKIGYMLFCPPHYARATEEILMLALERMRDIIELPLVNSKGQVQVAVVSGILKAAEMLDKRVKGAIMQKVAVHQHHTNGGQVQIPSNTLATDELDMLESEIKNIRAKIEEKNLVEIPRYHPDGRKNSDVIVESSDES